MRIDYFDINGIPCKAFAPDRDETTLAVLAAHGFGGDKESSAIEALAGRLCPRGGSVYCFDFPAHGTHPEGADSLTVRRCSDALVSVASLVREAHPTARKGVFATSFGGYITLLSLDAIEEALGPFSLVLRAPAVKMASTFERRIVGESMHLIEAGEQIECGFERPIRIGRAFLDDLKGHDAFKPYSRPMLIIHGDADDIVTVEEIDDFVAINPQARLARIHGADHRFKGEGHLDDVIRAAADFLALP